MCLRLTVARPPFLSVPFHSTLLSHPANACLPLRGPTVAPCHAQTPPSPSFAKHTRHTLPPIIHPSTQPFFEEWSKKLPGGLQLTFAEDENDTPPWEIRVPLDDVEGEAAALRANAAAAEASKSDDDDSNTETKETSDL
jgi:hypothetical protein